MRYTDKLHLKKPERLVDNVLIADLNGNMDIIDEEVDKKAKTDGFYEGMTVGLAENLLDMKATGALQEFGDRRTSCGDNSIADDGVGQIDSIHGNSVVLNQLRNEYAANGTAYGITMTRTENGISLSGTYDGTAEYGQVAFTGSINFKRDGRKYYIFANQNIPFNWAISGYQLSNADTKGFIWSNSDGSDWTQPLCIKPELNDEVDLTDLIVYVVDLKKCFGAGNEPSTVDDVKIKWLEKVLEEHPEFNEGQIVDFYGMKSAGDAYDELTPTKAIERVASINANELPFIMVASTEYPHRFTLSPENYITNTLGGKISTNKIINGYTNKGEGGYGSALNTDKSFDTNSLNGNIVIRDDRFDTVEDFIASLEGVEMYYELAEPIETPINPPLNLNYKVADFGTEEIVDGKMVTDGFNQFDMDNYFKNVPDWSKINDKWVGIPSSLMNYSNHSKPIWTNNVKYQGQIFITYIGKNTTQSNANFRFKFVYTDGTSDATQYVQTQSDKVLIGISAVGKIVDKITVDYGSNYEISISNININFSWSGYRNGEYEPYWKRVTDLHIADYFEATSTIKSAFIGMIKYNDDFTRQIANLPKNYISKETMQNFLAILGPLMNGTWTMTWNNNDQDYDFNFTGNGGA